MLTLRRGALPQRDVTPAESEHACDSPRKQSKTASRSVPRRDVPPAASEHAFDSQRKGSKTPAHKPEKPHAFRG